MSSATRTSEDIAMEGGESEEEQNQGSSSESEEGEEDDAEEDEEEVEDDTAEEERRTKEDDDDDDNNESSSGSSEAGDDEDNEESSGGDNDDDAEEVGAEDEDEGGVAVPEPPVKSGAASRTEALVRLMEEKAEAIEKDNEQLFAKIKEVRQLCRRGIRERKLLARRLDKVGDLGYRDALVVMPPGSERESESGSQGGDPTARELEPPEKPRRKRKATGNPVGRPKKPRAPSMPSAPSSSSSPAVVHRRPGRSAFFRYGRLHRESVSAELLALRGVAPTRKELTRALADRWNSLTAEEKRVGSFV